MKSKSEQGFSPNISNKNKENILFHNFPKTANITSS